MDTEGDTPAVHLLLTLVGSRMDNNTVNDKGTRSPGAALPGLGLLPPFQTWYWYSKRFSQLSLAALILERHPLVCFLSFKAVIEYYDNPSGLG